jgi:hypothetical protein
MQQRRLARPVRAQNRDTRVHIDTEGQLLVEIVLLLAAVGEGDAVERDDGRRELADVFKVEPRRREWGGVLASVERRKEEKMERERGEQRRRREEERKDEA